MSAGKFKSPHDRALIAFGWDVLAILGSNPDHIGDAVTEITESAQEIGLATDTPEGQFITIPRERFRNRLEL